MKMETGHTTMSRWRQGALLALGGAGVLGLYARTLAPDLCWGDGPGWAAAAVTLGVPPSTGCPGYLSLARLLLHLPLGGALAALNWMSALAGAAVAVGVAGCVMEVARLRRQDSFPAASVLGAVAGGWMAATSRQVWELSVTTELYIVVTAAMVIALWCSLRGTRLIDARWNALAWIALGFGLAVHPLSLFGAPSVLMAQWMACRRGLHSGRLCGWAAMGVVSGLLLYAYLPVRASRLPAMNWGDARTPRLFWRAVSGADFQQLKGWPSRAEARQRVSNVVRETARDLSPVPLVLAVIGWVLLGRRCGPLAVFCVGPLVMLFLYHTSEWESYLVPFHSGIGMAAGAAVCEVIQRAGQRRRWLGWAVLVVALAAVGIQARTHYAVCDKSELLAPRRLLMGVLDSLPPDSVLATEHSGLALSVECVQVVEGRRRDVIVVYPYLLRYEWYRSEIVRRHPTAPVATELTGLVAAAGTEHPVYYYGSVIGLPPAMNVTPYGVLFAIGAAADNARPSDHLRLMAAQDWPGAPPADPGTAEEYANIHLHLAQYYLARNELAEALTEARRAHELAPRESMTSASMGAVLLALGRAPEAVPCLQDALRLGVEDRTGEVWSQLGDALGAAGRPAEALDAHLKARRWGAEVAAGKVAFEALVAQRQSTACKLVADYTWADSPDPLAALVKATCLLADGRREEAITYLRLAAEQGRGTAVEQAARRQLEGLGAGP